MNDRSASVAFRPLRADDTEEVEALFTGVFSASEGEQEGTRIGRLAGDLGAVADERDVHGFVAVDGPEIVGAIFFSRLTFAVPREVFILAPVAVRDDRQGLGIGQALIEFGLQAMARAGATLAVVYGDPAFYGKVGFQPVPVEAIPPPHGLSQPEGWLAVSLTGDAIGTLAGPGSCVKALDDPVYW